MEKSWKRRSGENHAVGIALGLEIDAFNPSRFQLGTEGAYLPLDGFVADCLALPDIINEGLDGQESPTGVLKSLQ